MADTTTNYNIPIEDKTYPSLEEMLKDALELIDALIKANADLIADHETRISDLEMV